MRPREISTGVYCLPVSIANVYFVGKRADPWVLVDTAIPGRAAEIRRAAEWLYGAPPQAIVLTHGHMDHSGSALQLAQTWDLPIYAHRLEIPFLRGQSYPPGDPSVGGFLAMLSRFVSPKPLDFGDRVHPLPVNRAIPGIKDWMWYHTPGHSPGHVSLFRPADGTLIAGDAVTTMNCDSLVSVARRFPQVCPPPAPFTCDWTQARESVALLAELRPLTIAAGHGRPMSGGQAVMQLAELATDFPIPARGRYVARPAQANENGIVSLPPKPPDPLAGVAVGLGILAAGGAMFAVAAHRLRKQKRQLLDPAKADIPIQAS